MFESLSDRLSGIFDKLTRRGALTDSDVAVAMREVRRALIEADVALEVVKSFTDRVREKAVGQEVLKSLTPDQAVLRIVRDEMVAVLGGDEPVRVAFSNSTRPLSRPAVTAQIASAARTPSRIHIF